ncbi:MAG TPA: uroporphyrinogen decarboxylase family protein, partial [Thermodesulfovibrionales bacterium]|nr:uroporphyrinogen decarboxylase family protein [Thermodesulfovibrionales bacterium]
MAMTPRESILKAFAGGKAERVPVTVFGGGMWSIKDYGTTFEALALNAEKMTDMCVVEAEKIRSDVVYVGSGYNNFHAIALGRKYGVGEKYREIGAPDITDHFVHGEEDIAKLDMNDLFKEPVIKTVLDATNRVREKIGKKYLVTMTCWGPFTLAARFVGEEAFMKYTFKKPAFVEKMVDFCADLLIKLYEPLVNEGMEALSIADPTASGDLINPKQMSRFAVPPLKKMSDW